jgi:3-deoxy-D-manno-octulosonic-acid transferase
LVLLYNIFIQLYYKGIKGAATWNKKAQKWVDGRKNVFEELKSKISENDRIIWVHCSSAGEFEQGKPVIEALKEKYPQHKILVSFFSSSGYAVATTYKPADFITYLPLDTRQNAETFIRLIRPELAVFVKYEFWYHHLSVAAFHHIPVLLISATFREDQIFFKKYGGFFRQILFLFRHLFVQDESSLNLLRANGITHCSIGGDTRFDRVKKITDNSTGIPWIEQFLSNKTCIIAGSTWDGDEKLLEQYLKTNKEVKLILAPHEINKAHLAALKERFKNAIFYSAINSESDLEENSQVLIIDSVGLLSRIYQYATITYVGGGFTKDGIHNILEAAVWSKPVVFGPNYKKYREAKELIEAGGGFSVADTQALKKLADVLLHDEQYLQASSVKARTYVLENTGATQKILQEIQEKRLLTN